MTRVIGYVSDDYRHIVDELRRPLMLVTEYSTQGKTAFIEAVNGKGERFSGVAGAEPNARVVMRKRLD